MLSKKNAKFLIHLDIAISQGKALRDL